MRPEHCRAHDAAASRWQPIWEGIMDKRSLSKIGAAFAVASLFSSLRCPSGRATPAQPTEPGRGGHRRRASAGFLAVALPRAMQRFTTHLALAALVALALSTLRLAAAAGYTITDLGTGTLSPPPPNGFAGSKRSTTARLLRSPATPIPTLTCLLANQILTDIPKMISIATPPSFGRMAQSPTCPD
jgi:hypothetical protein